jgi:hypothetical protein
MRFFSQLSEPASPSGFYYAFGTTESVLDCVLVVSVLISSSTSTVGLSRMIGPMKALVIRQQPIAGAPTIKMICKAVMYAAETSFSSVDDAPPTTVRLSGSESPEGRFASSMLLTMADATVTGVLADAYPKARI